jgi:hypothetical protein
MEVNDKFKFKNQYEVRIIVFVSDYCIRFGLLYSFRIIVFVSDYCIRFGLLYSLGCGCRNKKRVYICPHEREMGWLMACEWSRACSHQWLTVSRQAILGVMWNMPKMQIFSICNRGAQIYDKTNLFMMPTQL